MSSRRVFVRRLFFGFAGAGLSLLAALSLAGCGDDTTSKLEPLQGNRDNPTAQRDMEIPPGIQSKGARPQNLRRRRIDRDATLRRVQTRFVSRLFSLDVVC